MNEVDFIAWMLVGGLIGILVVILVLSAKD